MKTIKKYKWWLIGAISLLLVLVCFFLPLPYYIEKPGGAYDIRRVVTVNKKEDKEKGSYNFVAVGVSKATPIQVLYAWLTPFTEVTSAQETTGGVSDEDYMRINQFYMETSQNGAIYEALTLANKKASFDYQGVYVLTVDKHSSFKGILNIADTVTGVNGKTFSSSKELIKYVSGLKLGSKVSVQYTSEQQKKTAKGKIIKLSNGKNGIGISLVDHTQVTSKDKIQFSTTGIGGPSAGLMFTLDIYDQLIKEDLRKGRIIAGTGTIGEDGKVGNIGGTAMKVAAADKIDADIFFVPNNPLDKATLKSNPKALNNYQEAKKAAKRLGTKMKIVPVKNVKDAIHYLRKH